MKKIVFLIWIIILSCAANAAIEFTTNQSDYYFTVGENAVIPVQSLSDKDVSGILNYDMTQQVQQAGMSFSSSNSQSKNAIIQKGNNMMVFDFGTANNPSVINAKIEFVYDENGNETITSLPQIIIHFVSDKNQQQNKQNQQKSTTQTREQQTQQQQQQTQNQMQQEIQQQMQQMQQNMQQQTNQMQNLQNNQMSQDSDALKQQMQQQMQETQQMKKEFAQQLEKNKQLMDENQKMLEQGYNLTNTNLDPTSNNTGNFELQYQKQNGETASLKGNMQNGELKDLQKQTSEDAKKMQEMLQNNTEYKKLDETLKKQGFNSTTPEFQQTGKNSTDIKVKYQNKNGEQQQITAQIQNNTVKNVQLQKKEEDKKTNYWIYALLALPIIALLIYGKFRNKKEIVTEKPKIPEKPFDYKKEALKMLEKAKTEFEQDRGKDAYATAAQAIRMYYSHKLQVKNEITNHETTELLKKNKINHKDTQKCLNLCGLVEFAKYETNKKDFEEIIHLGNSIIK